MAFAAIIDALHCIPKRGPVMQISDCAPFSQDLALESSGIAGAILAPCNCAECQHQWNCADRRTHEIVSLVSRNPTMLRGLASYDPLRIGESLGWIDEAVTAGRLSGTYTQAECCVAGLDAPRMYPLYGICAKLHVPVVLDFMTRDRWLQHRPQLEVIAADFPELDILLALPQHTESLSVIHLLERFPRVSILLTPQELQTDTNICEYVELEGRERTLFRSSTQGLIRSIATASELSIGPGARHAYLFENAAKMFNFPAEVLSVSA